MLIIGHTSVLHRYKIIKLLLQNYAIRGFTRQGCTEIAYLPRRLA